MDKTLRPFPQVAALLPVVIREPVIAVVELPGVRGQPQRRLRVSSLHDEGCGMWDVGWEGLERG